MPRSISVTLLPYEGIQQQHTIIHMLLLSYEVYTSPDSSALFFRSHLQPLAEIIGIPVGLGDSTAINTFGAAFTVLVRTRYGIYCSANSAIILHDTTGVRAPQLVTKEACQRISYARVRCGPGSWK